MEHCCFFVSTHASSQETLIQGAVEVTEPRKMWPLVSQCQNIDQIYFQQDGGATHFFTGVRNWLENHFPNRWIGRRSSIEWPALSWDMSDLDFFSGGIERRCLLSHAKNKFSTEGKKLKLAQVSFVVAGTVLQPRNIILNICITQNCISINIFFIY